MIHAPCCLQPYVCLGVSLVIRSNEILSIGYVMQEDRPPLLVRQTRNSVIADKPARRVYRSVKVTKDSTIPYVRYSFLLCNRNFVFKTRRFYDIRL